MSETQNSATYGLTNPEGTVQNIGILKNASTYFNVESTKQGWSFQYVSFQQQIIRFVILRDPYERYLSGLAEDIDRYLTYNNDKQEFFKNLIQNNFFFDFFDFLYDAYDANAFLIHEHTQLQTKLIEWEIANIGIQNMTFIKLTDKLGDNINMFLQGENCKTSFSNVKLNEKTRNNDHVSLYHHIYRYFLDGKNHKKKEKLLKYLEPDYKLINSINFFNRI